MTHDMTVPEPDATLLESEATLTKHDVVRQVARIQEIMDAVMVPDVHFGVIPGTKKPSLYKPGAEKLLLTFRLTPRYRIREEHDRESGYYRADVVCELRTIGRDVFVAEGVGRCSNDEEKYRWQRAVCEEQWQQADPTHRRKKYVDGRGGVEVIWQVATNLADKENTVLKMAKKRALVDAVLTATAASDIFDQDREDEAEEGIESDRAGAPVTTTTPATPQTKALTIQFGRCAGLQLNDPRVTRQDLHYYAGAAEKALADPKRSKWHRDNEAMLAACREELARREVAEQEQATIPTTLPPAATPDTGWLGYLERMASANLPVLQQAAGAYGYELADSADATALAEFAAQTADQQEAIKTAVMHLADKAAKQAKQAKQK